MRSLGAITALALSLLVLIGCASVEDLIAEGDRLHAEGRHAEGSARYWDAYHKQPEHPLVVERLGKPKPVPPTSDRPEH